jgi:O-methyltransferase involved in polyketide biosynthesis
MTSGNAAVAKPLARDGQTGLQLTAEQETLFIPLYAKALDFRSPRSILHDARADELVRSIDYDFGRLRARGNSRVLAARARQFDEWAREFLGRHPRSVVLNLGCGLDTRVDRLRPLPTVAWFDLDFPAVIELRRRFFSEREGYRMVGASLLDPDWLGRIPQDGPVLAIADGVFEYLSEPDLRAFVARLTNRFAHGELLFDVMNSFAVRMGNEHLAGRSEARLRWAVDDLRQADALNPGLRRVASVSALGSRYLPLGLRLAYGIAWLSPRLRNAMRQVRYEF